MKNNLKQIMLCCATAIIGILIGYGIQGHINDMNIESKKTDTVYSYKTVKVQATSKPTNTVINPVTKTSIRIKYVDSGHVQFDTIVLHDTAFIDRPTFVSSDTLHLDQFTVMIQDTGNCEGILKRHVDFEGSFRTVTVTNTITQKQKVKLFSLFAGAGMDLKQKNMVDGGPVLQLGIKNKISAGWMYHIHDRNNSLFLTFKITK